MADKKVELSLTESFAKHKRNLLLVSAIVVILAIASPKSVKIPGLGTSENLPAPAAYLCLGLALLYFFFSYWVELLAVRARNLEVAADDRLGGVSARLMQSINLTKDAVGDLSTQVKVITGKAKHFSEKMSDDSIKKVIDAMSASAKEAIDRSNNLLDISDKSEHSQAKHVERISANLNDIVRSVEKMMENYGGKFQSVYRDLEISHANFISRLDEIEVMGNDLSKKFDRISRKISRSQRLGFSALEQAVPVSLAAIALVMCLDGAFFGSGLTALLKDWFPILR